MVAANKIGLVVGIVAIAAVLGVSIVTLVKVFNLSKDKEGTVNSTSSSNNVAPALVGVAKSYYEAAKFFEQSINTSYNPCNDFYNYACGSYSGQGTFSFIEIQNLLKIIPAISSNNNSDLRPVKLTKNLYSSCMKAEPRNGTYLVDLVNAYHGAAGIPFPLFDGNATPEMPFPDPKTLAKYVGVLKGSFSINTLFSSYVDTNWVDPLGSLPYIFHLDQSSLTYNWQNYVGSSWKRVKELLRNRLHLVFNAYAKIATFQLKPEELNSTVENILEFEYLLANSYMTDENTPIQLAPFYNPATVSDFNAAYKNLDIVEYFTNVAGNFSKVKALFKKPSYYFNVIYPNFVKTINANLSHDVTAKTLTNYLNFRLINGKIDAALLGKEIVDDELVLMPKLQNIRTRGNRDGTVINDIQPLPQHILASNGITRDQYDCYNTAKILKHAEGRLFIDTLYPTPAARELIRNSVNDIVDSILISMQSMIDQLWWMTAVSKKSAYEKIQNVVQNIGYPDFLLDNSQLEAYYARLADFSATDDIYTILDKIRYFNLINTYDLLLRTNGTNREVWNSSPSEVNAWYMPDVNSITFPMSILRQPFFDPKWPTSVNYGSLGSIAGHELSHGFDSSGTQWNGFGELITWLDPESQAHFDEMTACVINEYNGFCPLSEKYSPRCINGQQTVGENVADNGGIRSAFRAYRNAISLNGLEPLLPGSISSTFNHDQLFFLSFAQNWCEPENSDAELYKNIITSVHPPARYRVWGTLQNFPAFKNAFNCPADSLYAPTDHCNVWISEINITHSKLPLNQINVANANVVKPNTPQLYTSYNQAAEFLRASVNFSVDPCEDFYQYTCGVYNGPKSFNTLQIKNYKKMVTAFENLNQNLDNSNMLNSTAISQTLIFYNKCKKQIPSLANDTASGDDVAAVINEFNKMTDIPFNWFENTSSKLIDSKQLAKALAYLSVVTLTDTLLTPMVDVRPNNNFSASFPNAYVLYIDQNTLTYSKSYYQKGAWKVTAVDLRKKITDLFETYAIQRNKKLSDTFTGDVEQILTLENKLGNQPCSADDISRRNYTRWIQKTISVAEANENSDFNFIDWNVYIESLSTLSKVNFVNDTNVSNYNIMIAEPDAIKNLKTVLKDSDLIGKYLYYRLLLSQRKYVNNPSKTVEKYESIVTEDLQFGRKLKLKDPFKPIISVEDSKIECVEQTLKYLQYANARVFTEFLYKTEDDRNNTIRVTLKLIDAVKSAMHSMIEDLNWISSDSEPSTLEGARSKIKDLQVNVAYPEFILNNEQLDKYYEKLSLSSNDDYVKLMRKLNVFNSYTTFASLTMETKDRTDFLGAPGSVNAWYEPELNSITLPEGILQQPYFDPMWPASINFGGLGVVIGHEITHGFDDQGVQWNGVGELVKWMSDTAFISFENMTECVVKEYDNFCPLNNTFTPNCLNGRNTLGENTADNGGIHSAYDAYQKWVSLNGPDPQLPSSDFSRFTHDQLFFLSFAQVWCQTEPSDKNIYTQILVDPHSPSKYRVFGTIQNFPGFRRAFNCPIGSAYAPEKYCSVWVPGKTN